MSAKTAMLQSQLACQHEERLGLPSSLRKEVKALLCALVLPALLILAPGAAVGNGGTHLIRLNVAEIIENEELKAVANLFIDRATGEIYVGRGNQLVILSKEGFPLWRIFLGNQFLADKVVVDKGGLVYVLNRKNWTVTKFNQFGMSLGELKVSDSGRKNGREKLMIKSIAIDNEDNLYVLDAWSDSCLVVGADGRVKRVIGKGMLRGYIDVDVSPDGSTVALINYSEGKIRLYDNKGEMLVEFGRRGGGPGTFSQPVAISLASDGRVFALDRNRQTILIFNREGQLNGELGGWGNHPGVFNYPNDIFVIFVDSYYEIFVADTRNNRLQRIGLELIEKR